MLWKIKPNLYRESSHIEEQIGYVFNHSEFLWEALTHRSALVGVPDLTEHDLKKRAWNERLEFLGDSVLSLVVSEALLASLDRFSEGEMSRIRAAIVCEENLARLARKIGLGKALVVGGSEKATGGQDKTSLLADGLEAVIGAVFRDGGWESARRVTQALFSVELTGDLRPLLDGDSKTKLQELVQARFRLTPIYEVTAENGPPHQKVFEVAVMVGDNIFGRGQGISKKDAAQAAARSALKKVMEVSP